MKKEETCANELNAINDTNVKSRSFAKQLKSFVAWKYLEIKQLKKKTKF